MRRFLGSPIDIYAAVVCLFFIAVCIAFPILTAIFFDEISLLVICIIISVVGLVAFAVIMSKSCDQFFSWGRFDDKRIAIFNLFKGKRIIEYKDIVETGVACFAGNRDLGSHIGGGFIHTYIYFSTFKRLSFKEKININRIKQTIDPPEQFIKLHFTKKNYKVLMDLLPAKIAKDLEIACREHSDRLNNNSDKKR